ncbi:hypothetical protein ACFV1L_10260 [Kitasatospora sp. NPDC059646]|uniref:hypothetical protein n=1 Tax=Kitasatospora sp. NPDC059646 TaxID=3346893 RepID=UPI0036CC4877
MADLVDVEALLAGWVTDVIGARPCTMLPADLAGALPIVQVAAIGGPAERFARRPRVDLDCYATTYEAARELGLRVEDAALRLRGRRGDAVVQWARVDSGPASRPYENPGVHRVGLTISLRVRPA